MMGFKLYQWLKRHYENKELSQDQYPYSIELDCGEIMNIKGFGNQQTSNKIKTIQYSLSNAFIKILYNNFKRFGNFVFLILLLLIFILSDQIHLNPFYNLVPLIVQSIIFAIKEIFYDKIRRNQDLQINQRKVTVFRKLKKVIQIENNQDQQISFQRNKQHSSQSKKRYDTISIFEQKSWQDLEVGDLICLKRNESAPADLLILDTQVSISALQTEGRINQIQKYPSHLTQCNINPYNNYLEQKQSKIKSTGFDYKKILTGIVKFRINDKNITGFIKINKDPKGDYFNDNNILYREQVLKNSQYAYAMVLFAGMNTWIYQTKSQQSSSFFHSKSKTFFALTITSCLFQTFVNLSRLLILLQTSWIANYFRLNYVLSVEQFFIYFFQYFQILPIYLYLILDLIELLHSIYHKHNYNQSEDKLVNFEQLNSATLADMVMSEYICFDKTGTLTSGYQKLSIILIDDKAYKFNYKKIRPLDFKAIDLNQIEENEEEDLIYQSPQGRLKRAKQSFKLSLNPGNYMNKSSDHNYTQIQPPISDDNLIENIRIEDLNDSHCKITEELKNKPKPFFNKEQSQLSPFESPNISVSPIPLYQEQYSMNRSDSEHLRKQQIQQDNTKRYYENEKLIDYLSETEFNENFKLNRKLYLEALINLAICHKTKSYCNSSDDSFFHDSFSCDDQIIYQFAQSFGIKFLCQNYSQGQLYYLLEIDGEIYDIQILSCIIIENKLIILYEISTQLYKHFSLEKQINLAIREEIFVIPSYVEMDKYAKEYWDKILIQLKFEGLRTVLYSSKHLLEKEKEEILQKLIDVKQKTNQEMYKILRPYEKDMQIIQVIGLKEKLKQKNQKKIIQNFKEANLKLWMLSGDQLTRVVSVGYNTKIIKEEYKIIQFDDPKEISIQIKNFLQGMNRDIQKKLEKQRRKLNLEEGNEFQLIKSKSIRSSTQVSRKGKEKDYFAIVITGECYQIIEQDLNLFNHFCFLAYFSKCLIGCELSNQQKASLVQAIQKKFPGNRKVIAIGDGYNDMDMLNIADTGIQIYQEFQPSRNIQAFQRRASKLRSIINQQYVENPLKKYFPISKIGKFHTAQYKIKDLITLVNLLFYEARYWAELMDDFLVICFYRALLIGYLRFLWNFSFEGDEMALEQNSIILIYQSVCLFSILIFNGSIKLKNQNKNLEIYKYQFKSNIKIFKKKKILSFLFKINGNAFIDATSLILSMISLSSYIIFDNQLQVILIQQLFAYDVMRAVYQSNSVLKYNILLVILYILYVVAFFLITLEVEEYTYIVTIFTYPQVTMNVLFTLFLSTVINKTMEYCFAQFLNQELIHDNHDFSDILTMVGLKKQNKKKKLHNYIKSITVIVGKLFQTKDQLDISIQEMISGENKQITRDKINPITLQFQVRDNEIKYKRLLKQNWLKFDKVQHLLSYILLEMALIFFNLITNTQFNLFSLIMSISAVFQLFISGIVFSSKYIKHFFTVNLAVVLLRSAFKFLADLISTSHYPFPQLLITQTFSQFICFTRVHFPITNFSMAFMQTISFMVYNIQTSDSKYFILNSIAISLTTFIMVSTIQYKISYLEKEDFMLENTLNLETQQINNVLAILLPKFIRDRIDIDGKYNIAQKQDQVAILFCDICNFDNIISIEQSNILNLLDTLFRKFDSLCMLNHLQKIETVGKTYMAACLNKNQNQVEQALQLALDMKEFVSNYRFGQVGLITIKIGIHYGSVIAGVIGDHKPQFSLIGDTVNTTSRVCSTGQDGEITLSDQAYEMVQNGKVRFITIEVEAKGKGVLVTHQVCKNSRQAQGRKKGLLIQHKTFKQKEQSRQPIIQNENRIKEIKQKRVQGSYQFFKEGSINKQDSVQFKSRNMLSNNNMDKLDSKLSREDYQERNIQQYLEQKLEKEVIIEQLEDNPEFEVEIEKVRAQFMIQYDEQAESQSLLKLSSKTLFLDFQKSELKKEFQQKISKQGQTHTLVILYLTTFIFFLKSATLVLVTNQSMLMGRIIVSSLFLIFSILQTKKIKFLYQEWYFIIAYLVLIATNVSESLKSFEAIEIQASEATMLLSFFCSIQLIEMKKKVGITIIVFFLELINYGIIYNEYQILYFIALQCSIELIFQYVFFIGQINTFNRTLILKKKKFQSDKLLKYLLPSHILGQFLSNTQRMVLVEEFEEATLLFADIAGFTAYSSQNDPETVVNMLRNLFTEFDRYCLSKNIYKLYTIGDCYVILGIVDASQRKPAEEAKNVVEMGFIMREIILQVRREINFEGLDMRIGIHTGKIICGILGTDIVRYDVYGEDVMISNKMESNGSKGKIQISEETKKLIEQAYPYEFQFEFNKEIEFKSTKRKTNGYFVEPIVIESERNLELEECQFDDH